jgi:hypothetical protein
MGKVTFLIGKMRWLILHVRILFYLIYVNLCPHRKNKMDIVTNKIPNNFLTFLRDFDIV